MAWKLGQTAADRHFRVIRQRPLYHKRGNVGVCTGKRQLVLAAVSGKYVTVNGLSIS